MIEEFAKWVAIAGECTTTFARNQGDSAFVDFEAADRMARITLWEDGNCDMEAIDIPSGKQIFWQHHTFENTEEMRDEVAAFVKLHCKGTDRC